MVATKLLIILMLSISFGIKTYAQEKTGAFIPAIFWEASMDKGVLLVAPTKMEIFDNKGAKLGKILAAAPVLGAYMAPDGKKLAYATSAGLWLVKLGAPDALLITAGSCTFFSWNSDGSSFMFAIYEKNEVAGGNAYNIKLFWADGEGKSLKQVYP